MKAIIERIKRFITIYKSLYRVGNRWAVGKLVTGFSKRVPKIYVAWKISSMFGYSKLANILYYIVKIGDMKFVKKVV